ncbi:hypothetical protein SAMN05444166_7281 [Singulisphaera sp. GP187]|nr:hypothetical protein SAMN05444166_7281 [Singulisphaera sp. GP187]
MPIFVWWWEGWALASTWVPHDTRDSIIDFVRHLPERSSRSGTASWMRREKGGEPPAREFRLPSDRREVVARGGRRRYDGGWPGRRIGLRGDTARAPTQGPRPKEGRHDAALSFLRDWHESGKTSSLDQTFTTFSPNPGFIKNSNEHGFDSPVDYSPPGLRSGLSRFGFAPSQFDGFGAILPRRIRRTLTDDERLLIGSIPMPDAMNKRSCHHMTPLPDAAL